MLKDCGHPPTFQAFCPECAETVTKNLNLSQKDLMRMTENKPTNFTEDGDLTVIEATDEENSGRSLVWGIGVILLVTFILGIIYHLAYNF